MNTKTPSDVAGSASGFGSWIQKPFVDLAVTMPLVDTTWPLNGEMCAAPWMSLIASSGPSTESAIGADVERACASATVHGSVFEPGAVPAAIVAEKENVLSPAAASPFEPLSKSDCVVAPPIAERLHVTARPVLAGSAPAVTATVSSVDAPADAEAGFAAPTPVGGADPQMSCGAELRGLGEPTVKSAALLSVSNSTQLD